MPKFYVTSGSMKHLSICETPQQAVLGALVCVNPSSLSTLVKVSEKGFDSVNPDDMVFLTELMLLEAGIRHDFTHISDDPPGIDPNLAEG